MPTILIVEDDYAVRQVIEAIIKSAHPDAVIVPVNHGSHARDVMRTFRKKFDLALVDVVARADINSIQLLVKIKKEHPGTRVILMSGTEGPEGHNHYHAFLKKPFKMAKLLSLIDGLTGKP